MSRKALVMVLAIVFLLITIGVIVAITVLTRPRQIEIKSTPFSTHEGMLAINITARRLASPSIDDIMPLEQGRISSSVSGDSKIKLLDASREELFVLEFEVSYANTSNSTNLRDEVLMTFVLPCSPEAAIVRIETPQGSAERRIEAQDRAR